MKFVLRALIVCAVVVAATPAWAQFTVNTDTVVVSGRTSWEDGYLSTFAMDRGPVGARMTGMAGAGLALLGGSEFASLNPAALLGVRRPELAVEAVLHSGSAGVKEFPALLDFGNNIFLEASNYRIRPKEALSYNNLSLGLPLVLFGNRGVATLAYRRVARTGAADETRVELRGPITNQADATFGLGDLPEDSMDAITLSLAREFASWLNVGANFNWQTGTLDRTREIGVSIFGFQQFASDSRFKQDVSSFNVDLGTRFALGSLSLAGTVYLGYDVTFDETTAEIRPIPSDPQNPNQRIFIKNQLMEHTLSVPTMYGLGSAYEVNNRLTVAADYWIRSWSQAEVTRQRVEPIVGFADPGDSTTYFFLLPRIEGEEEILNAGLHNTHSIRVGLEYGLVDRPTLKLPLRIGYRKEDLTINHVSVPDVYANYSGLIADYFNAQPGTNEHARLEQALKDVAEFNNLLFQGDNVNSSTFSIGLGIIIDDWSADLTFERVSYDYDRFFLQDFDPLINPVPAVTEETRNLLNLSFSTTMRF